MLRIWPTADGVILRKILHELQNRNQPQNDHQRDAHAKHATRLLTDDVFNDAYGRVLERITDEIICTKAQDSARRDELHAEIRALHRVVHELNALAAEAVIN
tara:strand:+ start:240 stop:545 length:306 start_codon:yes stop_codon:yes gene_type:complete